MSERAAVCGHRDPRMVVEGEGFSLLGHGGHWVLRGLLLVAIWIESIVNQLRVLGWCTRNRIVALGWWVVDWRRLRSHRLFTELFRQLSLLLMLIHRRRYSLWSSCSLKSFHRFCLPRHLLLLLAIVKTRSQWWRSGSIYYFGRGLNWAFKLFLGLLRNELRFLKLKYFFCRSLTEHWVVGTAVLLVAIPWKFFSIAARIIIPWATALIQVARSASMSKTLLPTLLITSASSSSMTIPRSTMLIAAPMSHGIVRWNVASEVRSIACCRLNVMYVFLESVRYLGLMTSCPRGMPRLPLIPTARSGLMQITLVHHLRRNLLIMVVVLLLGITILPFDFWWCQPL